MVGLESKKSKVRRGRHSQLRDSERARLHSLRSAQPAFQALTTVLLEAAKFNASDEELTLVAEHFIHGKFCERHVQLRLLTPSPLSTQLPPRVQGCAGGVWPCAAGSVLDRTRQPRSADDPLTAAGHHLPLSAGTRRAVAGRPLSTDEVSGPDRRANLPYKHRHRRGGGGAFHVLGCGVCFSLRSQSGCLRALAIGRLRGLVCWYAAVGAGRTTRGQVRLQ